MSARPIHLAAALVVSGLAFGVVPTAPALADGIAAPSARHHIRHAPRVRTIYRERVVHVPVPQYYANPCGGCGAHVGYAPHHHFGSCGGCGYSGAGYVEAAGYEGYQLQYAPAYSGYFRGGYVGTHGGYRGRFHNRSLYGRRAMRFGY
jgi:hypothetical protein